MRKAAKTYRYRLDDSSRKFRCPQCDKKRFVKFKDFQTRKYLAKKYGRCDRESSCGYFIDPYKDGYTNEDASNGLQERAQRTQPLQVDHIPENIHTASLKGYGNNKFVQYLDTLFDSEKVQNLINTYLIGTSKHWEGATVFWQIDTQGNIRTGKIMLYDDTGHRVKEPTHINWVHSLLYDDYNLEQCLFGEHLLAEYASKSVAIVESEKTAVISSVYFPEFIWLAAGSKSSLNPERCSCLIGRHVVLFPDVGAYEAWWRKANALSYFCNVTVSGLLEKNASSDAKKEGYDLADYLIQYKYESFRSENHS